MLRGHELAAASGAAEDFIEDQVDAVSGADVPHGAEVLAGRHDRSRRESAHGLEYEGEDVLGSKLEDLGFKRSGAVRCGRPRAVVCLEPVAHRRGHLVRGDREPIE